jgi:hypothetical protein
MVIQTKLFVMGYRNSSQMSKITASFTRSNNVCPTFSYTVLALTFEREHYGTVAVTEQCYCERVQEM